MVIIIFAVFFTCGQNKVVIDSTIIFNTTLEWMETWSQVKQLKDGLVMVIGEVECRFSFVGSLLGEQFSI